MDTMYVCNTRRVLNNAKNSTYYFTPFLTIFFSPQIDHYNYIILLCIDFQGNF